MIAPLCVFLLSPVPPPAPAAALALDTKALYIQHCASCHGENGDGKGTAELDRPARSFLDGGYSYGNTEKAVIRSIVHGIPGTPMPAFKDTLAEEERSALAAYVIGLGPKGTVVEPGASVLSVGDKPLVVQGMMPSMKEGGRREPRSVIVGFPNGATFQYRAGTMELQAIRVGDFLDRRDWGGRGGAELKPLGKVTWSPEADDAKLSVTASGGKALSRTYTGARVGADSVFVNFRLKNDEGTIVGGGNEHLSFVMVEGNPVALRSCLISARAEGTALAMPDGEPVAEIRFEEDSGVPTCTVRKAAEGLFVMEIGGMNRTVATFVYAAKWTDALEEAIRAQLAPASKEDK